MSIVLRKAPLIGRTSHYRAYSTARRAPFGLANEDDSCNELNQMYTDMFTQTTKSSETKKTSEQNENYQFLLDELNSETDQLFNVGYPKLLGEELKQKVEGPGRFIIQSLSKNPYYNLALENYIFNNTPITQDGNGKFKNQRLLFYVNNKCVVIGKNQTVWKEVYLSGLAGKGYELLRRFSGGGTVVHDLGNVNYSFITSREEFERDFFNKQIVKWLMNNQPGFPLALNQRGDIVFENKKVSGSAFKIAKGKSYHHGTMLINSDLDGFRGLLKPSTIEGISWRCNSVDSVRSEVTNIPLQSGQQFIDICTDGFKQFYDPDNFSNQNIPVYYCDEKVTSNSEIQEYISKLQNDEWKYLAGPRFDVSLENGNHSISVEKGYIKESSIPGIVGCSFKNFARELDKFKFIDQKLLL